MRITTFPALLLLSGRKCLPKTESTTGNLVNKFYSFFLPKNIFSIPVVAERTIGREKWLNATAEPENRKTLLLTKEYFEIIEQKAYRSGKSSIGLLSQNLPKFLITFSFAPFDPFFEHFDRYLQRYVESGMFNDLVYGDKKLYGRSYNEEVPPLVLTMDDLAIGFLVCLIPMVLSAIVFFIEVSKQKIETLAIRIRDALVAKSVVEAFVKSSF